MLKFNVNKQKVGNTISKKLLMRFIISVLLIVSIIGLSSYFISNYIIETKVTEASEQTIVQAGEKVEYIFDQYKEKATTILMNQDFIDALGNYGQAQGEGNYQLKNQITDHIEESALMDPYLDLYLINQRNDEIITSLERLPDLEKEAILQSDWYRHIKETGNSFVWIGGKERLEEAEDHTSGILLGQTIRASGSEFFLLMELHQELMQNVLQDIQFGDNGFTKIVDSNNEVVFSFNPEEINQVNNYEVPMNSEDRSIEKNGQYILQDQIGETGWFLTGAVSKRELTKDTRFIFYITIGMIGLAILFSFIIGKQMARWIGNPLQEISSLMAQVKQGDLTVRSQSTGRGDEIGTLAEGFNDMLDNIDDMLQRTRNASNDVLHVASELTELSTIQSTTASEIATASENIASGASDLTHDAENGNQMTGQINEEVERVFSHNQEMETVAEQLIGRSEMGRSRMNELVEQTKNGEQMTNSLLEKVDHLQASTNKISDIMAILTNIAEQTSLLSLNASIEAARAGEAGQGFAVVANEIRQLSSKSRESINIVGSIINEIMEHVDDTFQVLKEANPIFQDQVRKAEQTNDLLQQVGTKMDEFTEKISLVTQSIQQLRTSQSNLHETISEVSATAQESSSISEEVTATTEEQVKISDSLVETANKLEKLSENLHQLLDRFNMNDGVKEGKESE